MAKSLHSEDVPTINCYKIDIPIQIDGDLSKPVWSRATWVNLSRNGEGEPVRQASRVGVLWDDRNLYVGFEFEDDQPNGAMTRRDDPLWEDGNVSEVFIDPEGVGQTFYEFQINPLNTLLDLFYERPSQLWQEAKHWDAQGIQTAVQIDRKPTGEPTGWAVEMAIPWSNFHTAPILPPEPGQSWRANFYRYDTYVHHGGVTLELSSWSDTYATNFDVPSRFGRMNFM